MMMMIDEARLEKKNGKSVIKNKDSLPRQLQELAYLLQQLEQVVSFPDGI